ncbi:hypothetical protein ACFLSJ_06140 [Verrucomicrobiota bacterium]
MPAVRLLEPIDKVFSPKGLIVRGGILAVLFLVSHAVGLREFTGFLSGTLEAGAGRREVLALLGFVYVILYLLFTVVVPVLFIAAAMSFTWGHVRSRRRTVPQ